MSRSVDSSAEKVVMAEISGDGSKLTDITLEQITRYGTVTTRKLTLRNVVTDGTSFGISNTAPQDTLSVGTTAFINNLSKKLTVKGTIISDTYDVSQVSNDQDVLFNDGGNLKGANNITHNKTTGAFTVGGRFSAGKITVSGHSQDNQMLFSNAGTLEGANNITHNKATGAFTVGGRFSAGKITVSGHSQDNQLLFSNAGTLEGAPVTYDGLTNTVSIPGKLNVQGGITVNGEVTQIKATNVIIDDPILEISSNSLDDSTSGIVIQRPSGNVAVSYQDDNTLNMSYTTGSSYGTNLPIDTTRSLPVKIQGTLRVLKGIDIQDKAQNNQLLYSNAGTIEGAPITYDKTSNVTHVATNLSFGKLQVGGHAQNKQVLYSNAGTMEGSGIKYNPVLDKTTIQGTLEVVGGIVGDISGGVTIDSGNNQELLYNDNGAVAGTTVLFNKTTNATSFPNKLNVSEINFL